MGRRRNTSRKNSRKKTRAKSGGLDPKMREEIVLLFCCLFSFLLFFWGTVKEGTVLIFWQFLFSLSVPSFLFASVL